MLKSFKNKTILVLFIICIIAVSLGSKLNKERNKDEYTQVSELKSQLSDSVTKDSLQGTYESKKGDIFAIKVYDEEALEDANFLEKTFGKNTTSAACAFFSNIGWTTLNAQIDGENERIKIIDDYSHPTEYSFLLNGKKLTLVDSDGKKQKYKKISDEFDGEKLCDPNMITINDITGLYSIVPTMEAAVGTSLENKIYRTSRFCYIQITKTGDETVRVVEFFTYDRDIFSEVYIWGFAEDVDFRSFSCNKNVSLQNMQSETPIEVHFVGEKTIADSLFNFNFMKVDFDVDIENELSVAKKCKESGKYYSYLDSSMNTMPDTVENDPYNNSEERTSDDGSIKDTNMIDSTPSSFNYFDKSWYEKYSIFYDEDHDLQLELCWYDNGYVDFIINGITKHTIDSNKYECNEDENGFTTYTSFDGQEISYICLDGKSDEAYVFMTIDGENYLFKYLR